MEAYFYEELKGIYRDINEVNTHLSKEEIEDRNTKLISAVNKILDLSKVGREKGLLALEELISPEPEKSSERLFARLMKLVIDGSWDSTIKQVGVSRYICCRYKDYEALHALIYIHGCLGIQNATSIVDLREELMAMLPEDMYSAHWDRKRSI